MGIDISVGDGVAEVVIDYPPVNALPARGWLDLAGAVTSAGADPGVHAVILAATGRGFCAGVDIKEIQTGASHGALIEANRGCFAAFAARLTFEPELLVTDGEAMLLAPSGGPGGTGGDVVEGWLPYRDVLRLVATGRRHMMMGAAQLDRYGNQNISAIGDWARPKAQLLGFRGAPGNTINHPVSYWIGRHSPRVLVERVDVVCGIGYDRAATVRVSTRPFHEIRIVVTDKAVLDFNTPDHSMRVRSVHPGVSVEQVRALTGFALVIPDDLAVTPMPTPTELDLIQNVLDPAALRDRELA